MFSKPLNKVYAEGLRKFNIGRAKFTVYKGEFVNIILKIQI